ncbi:uracil phosphoribosyltransferase/pyrimidine operon attenuation protein [Fulvivirga imtechensis AK7]|uniref:Uracil phosphoribosyltransferase/pyrimidine operon attenuation protein n=1 Tax=Fulvivirga imtechensis AK7 TaxID=1237149 RepID=L8JQY9_9BACT|nr:phosphoribosyltransferase family protein [Fulvivirga imtechensis]ELR71265.1 uracil phosphoribosyltransferase/pyrimidine operon attenuation protein [Fulvivirga imtechensis AK7]
MGNKGLILSDAQVRQKIKRIAYEIYENNFQEKDIILAGIQEQGYELARLLLEELQQIASFKTTLIGVRLDKFAPTQSEISLDCDVSVVKNKCIILIDDVMNTGRTMAYSLKPFLNVKVKKIETAVLVNRSHTQFPISIQYTGYELATTIKEHVEVQLENDRKAVYLQ